MKSTEAADVGESIVEYGVKKIVACDASQFVKSLNDDRDSDPPRCVVADLTAKNRESDSSNVDLEYAIEKCRLPMVAAVSGHLDGWGVDLAILSHLCYADREATFELTGAVSSRIRMARMRGSKIVSAAEMVRAGFLNSPLCEGDPLEKATYMASRISAMAPLAVRDAIKAAAAYSTTDIPEGLRIERELFANLFQTRDMRSGTSAFLGKRKPRFRGE